MTRSNLTLQFDEEMIREAKVLAAEKGTSVSALMAHFLRKVIAREARYKEAMRAAFESMTEAAASGRAAPRWNREEIYDRW
jgi:hypothetical protein